MLFWTYSFGMVALMASAISGSSLTAKHNIELQMFEQDLLKFCGSRMNGLYENPKNCRETIQCTDGTGVVAPCPNPGDMWDPSQMACAPSTFTSCKQRDILCDKALGDKSFLGRSLSMELASLNATLTEPQHVDADTFKFTDATDRADLTAATFSCQGTKKVSRSPLPTCTEFNTCIKGRAFTGECPTGFSFDAPTLMCVPNGEQRCYQPPLCTNPGVGPVAGVCNRFQICCGGLGQVVYCKSGFSYDIGTGMCVPSAKATCQ